MNYQRIHDAIIYRARNRVLEGYRERHHIVPKCMGGLNHKSNCVYLTAREHYLIHWLLVKIFPTNDKLIYAFWMMCNGSNKDRPNTNSRMYSEARNLFSNLNKGRIPYNKGISPNPESIEKRKRTMREMNYPNSFLGKKHSVESKLKQSISAKNRNMTDEQKRLKRERQSKSLKGKKRTDSQKAVMSLNKMGKYNHMSIPIYQYDINGSLIKVWESKNQINKHYNINHKRLDRVLNNNLLLLNYYWFDFETTCLLN